MADFDDNGYEAGFEAANSNVEGDIPARSEQGDDTRALWQSPIERVQRPDATISLEGLDLFLARIGAEGVIHYANSALAQYVGVSKADLLGQPASLFAQFFDPEISKWLIKNPGEPVSEEVRDDRHGKVLQLKVTPSRSGYDIVIQDVTSSAIFRYYARKYIPTDLERLGEEDLDTFFYPEKRFMTVSFCDLRGFTQLTESLTPEQVRTTINNYLEDVIEAIEGNRGTVDKIVGDEVMALFGAPIYNADHAFRAIKTACDVISSVSKLQETYLELGQHLPGCGIGINTGEMVVGNIGSTTRQNYTVLGSAVNLASRLCDAARAGEILLTEETFHAALTEMPKGWVTYETESESAEELQGVMEKVHGVFLLPGDFQDKIVLVGPKVKEDPESAELIFQYLYGLRVGYSEELIPVLSVRCPSKVCEVTLNDEKIIHEKNERIFGKYRLLERISRGGMGEVWKAKDQFDNLVAIKTLIAGEAATERQVARFRREAETMARLVHRDICRVYEVGEVDRVGYIAMEYIDGVTLSQVLELPEGSLQPVSHFLEEGFDLTALIKETQNRIRERGEETLSGSDTSPNAHAKGKAYRILPKDLIFKIINRISSGMMYAHSHAVLHRDLKPANIMLRADGEPVIMDFGLAKLDDDDHRDIVSMSGQILGTVDFMAPEQALSSKDVDVAADVYSLGAIMYQMCTGYKHFQSTGNILSDAQTLQDHRPVPPRERNRNIDQDLQVIIMKALRSDVAQRYRSITGFRNDMERYVSGEVIEARPITLFEVLGRTVKKHKAVAALSVMFALTVTGLVVVSFLAINRKRLEAEAAMTRAQIALEAQKLSEREAQTAKKEALAYLQKFLNQEKATQQAVELSQRARFELAKDFLVRAERNFRSGNYLRAARNASLATKRAPEMSEAWYQFGLSNQKAGKNKEALDALEKGLKLAPKEEKEKFTQAITEAEEGIKSATTVITDYFLKKEKRQAISPEIAMKAGAALKEEERYSEALEAYKLALANAKTPIPDARINLFHIQARMETAGYKESDVDFTVKDGKIVGMEIGKSALGKIPPVGDMPLELLRITGMRKVDLATFRFLHLKQLELRGCKVEHLNEIAGMASLEMLDLRSTGTSDISFLESMKIRRLNLSKNPVADIKPLRKLPLSDLDLSETHVKDLSVLQGMPLNKLNISQSNVTSIAPLTGIPVKELYLDQTRVSDLSPIRYNLITNLSIRGTDVQDLEALSKLKLVFLDLSSTLVSSLKPLNVEALEALRMKSTNITDLRVLDRSPLKRIAFDPEKIGKGVDSTLRSLKSLEKIEADAVMKSKDFWSKWDAGYYGKSKAPKL